MKSRGKLFIISGPSQVGKDTVVTALKKKKRLNLKGVVTNTTRTKRPGEKSGVGLNFLNDKQFDQLIVDDKLLEWARVRGSRFGTPKEPVLKNLMQGHNVIINIDVQGAAKITKKVPGAVLIFITAESRQAIKQRIFSSKKMTSNQKTDRWREAQSELKAMPKYHYIIVNRWGKIGATVSKISKIIEKHGLIPPLTKIK